MRISATLLLCIVLMFGAVSAIYAKEDDNFSIKPQFTYVYHHNNTFNTFSEGLAWVGLADDGHSGVIDRQGNLLFDGFYLDPDSYTSYVYSEGLSRVLVDGDWSYIDRNGNVVIATDYDTVLNFREGLAAVSKNGKWGFIDRTGKEVIAPQYDEVRDDDGYGVDAGTSGFYEGLAAVNKNGQWGFINKSGHEVIKPNYEWVNHFHEGLAAVTNDGKWGYIDKSGKVVIALKYDEVLNFSEGLGAVLHTNDDYYHWGFVDKYGREVLDFNNKYWFVEPFNEGVSVAYYREDDPANIYVILDKSGNEIVNLGKQYSDMNSFNEGLAYVYAQDGGIGLIDKKGREVIQPIYYRLNSSSNGLIGASLESRPASYGFISNPLDVPSEWAEPEIQAASVFDILPIEIEYGYKDQITRADFSKLALYVLSARTNKSIGELLLESDNSVDPSAIDDTFDSTVLAAHTLGIISGRGHGRLDPQGLITRQEAAVMIARVAEMLHVTKGKESISFADNQRIASWAKESVAFIAAIKDETNGTAVMSGVGDGQFAPNGTFTKEQAFVTMKRLYNAAR